MQVTITSAQITVPTPEPYDSADPDKQRENLAYVALQLCSLAKQAGVKLTYTDDDVTPVGLRLDGVALAARDLQYNDQVIDLGAFKIILSGRTVSLGT